MATMRRDMDGPYQCRQCGEVYHELGHKCPSTPPEPRTGDEGSARRVIRKTGPTETPDVRWFGLRPLGIEDSPVQRKALQHKDLAKETPLQERKGHQGRGGRGRV